MKAILLALALSATPNIPSLNAVDSVDVPRDETICRWINGLWVCN